MLVKLTPTDFDALMVSARAGLQAQATLLDAINKSAIEQVKAEQLERAHDDTAATVADGDTVPAGGDVRA